MNEPVDVIFNQEERHLLGRLADVLIPAGNDALSASQADVSGVWLDKVLEARPDLVDELTSLLEKARAHEPAEVIAEWQMNDPEAFGVLAEVITGAYFMNPKVRQAIGYEGQNARPIDPRPDYMEDGLLESVIRRGPIYRSTPS